MLEQLLTQLIPGLVGAAGSGIPLYIALRKATSEIRESKLKLESQLKESEAKLSVELDKQKSDNTNAQKINTEAEWKRVIDEKNEELIRLRAKDDEQEVKLSDLLNRHIECQKNEARNEVKLQNFDNTTREQARQIKALTTKLLQLDKIVRGNNAPVSQSGSGTHETLLGIAGETEEAPGSGPGEDLRTSGSAGLLPPSQSESKPGPAGSDR